MLNKTFFTHLERKLLHLQEIYISKETWNIKENVTRDQIKKSHESWELKLFVEHAWNK